MQSVSLSPLLTILGWGVVLLIVQIALQGALATLDLGLPYNASPRDEGRQPNSVYAQRTDRALRNMLETFPAFVALALALAITGKTAGWAQTGALLWLFGRIAYLPLYLLGVPYLRTLAWLVSLIGLLAMLMALFS
jgi:uncharacterized MAPEG superfamily protein